MGSASADRPTCWSRPAPCSSSTWSASWSSQLTRRLPPQRRASLHRPGRSAPHATSDDYAVDSDSEHPSRRLVRIRLSPVVATAAADLARAGVPSPRVDAELLAAHVLGVPRGRLLLVES